MGILDELQRDVWDAFLDEDSPFLASTLIKQTGVRRSCRVFRDSFSLEQRTMADMPDTDVKMMVLRINDAEQVIEVELGDSILHKGKYWTVINLFEQDPADATMTFQCRPVEG